MGCSIAKRFNGRHTVEAVTSDADVAAWSHKGRRAEKRGEWNLNH